MLADDDHEEFDLTGQRWAERVKLLQKKNKSSSCLLSNCVVLLSRCHQLREDINHPGLWDNHGNGHTERGENRPSKRQKDSVASTQIRDPLLVPCVAVGEGENAAGLVPGGPSVPGPALFAHGDHQDVRPGRTQHGAPLQGRLCVSRSVALIESPSKTSDL